MAYQTILPRALAARGLIVETVPGWETRGSSSFSPGGAICHWTAGPRRSLTRPSLNICVNGRSDLPGPLANVYLDRNGVAVVLAAGKANHAGNGNWRGLTHNGQLFGTEAEAADSTDFTTAQRVAYPKVNAAYGDIGGFDESMVAGHSEFALPRGRKQDINGYTMDDMRSAVRAVRAGKTDETSKLPDVPEDTDMKLIQSTNRGIAVIGPGYFKQLTEEELPEAVVLYGMPVVGNDRQFDLRRAIAVNGDVSLSPRA